MTINTDSPLPTSNRQILDEASAWFVEFRVGDTDGHSRAEFDRWLRKSPEHIRAYLEIARVYYELSALGSDQIANLSEPVSLAQRNGNVIKLEPNAPGEPVPNGARFARPDGDSQQEPSAINECASLRHRFRPKLGRWIPASFAAAAAAGLLVWIMLPKYPAYSTGVGENRTITMSDGSIITLNALTDIQVRYTTAERVIDLVSGQAFFQVTANKYRPFVVRSGFAVVKDVGTQFDVDRAARSTTVTVVEGLVALYSESDAHSAFATQRDSEPKLGYGAVSPASLARASASRGNASSMSAESPPDSGSSPAVILAAGEQAVVSEHEISTQTHANIGAATSWLKHRFIFDGSHLSDVVDQFNRYNSRQIIIDNAALDGLRISGVYSSTDPDSFLRFLGAQPGIEVTQLNGAIHIDRK